MRTILLFFLICTCIHAQDAVRHRVLIAGCGYGSIQILGEDGKVEWRMTEKDEADDAWMLPNGSIIYAFKHGVRVIKPDLVSGEGGELVWERKTPQGGETHSCQPLDNNRFLIGESYNDVSKLLEIDTAGVVYKSIELRGLGGKHSTFRQVRKTPQGTYLITQQRRNGIAMEIDESGAVIRRFVDGKFVAIRLRNGNTLIACGDAHRVIEVDPNDKIVWEVKQHDVDGISLGFVAGLQRLPNGNTLICNWGGHGGSKGAAVIQVTPDKKLVWQTPDTVSNRVATVQVLSPAAAVSTTR